MSMHSFYNQNVLKKRRNNKSVHLFLQSSMDFILSFYSTWKASEDNSAKGETAPACHTFVPAHFLHTPTHLLHGEIHRCPGTSSTSLVPGRHMRPQSRPHLLAQLKVISQQKLKWMLSPRTNAACITAV